MLLREPARPGAVREHRLAPWFAVITVCFGAFMGQLDASAVTLAFPALQSQFGTTLAQVQWVSLAYLLVLVALLVPVGRWSDRFGRKLVYLYGFGLFTAASAACGLAPTLSALIALRVVQAAGAAMLQANSVALVSTSTPPAKRRTALAVQAAAQALGLAIGPLAGGLLVASAGWRWIFLINVPVGLIAVMAGVYLLPRTRHRAARQGADALGVALLATSVAGLLVAVSALSGPGLPTWTSPAAAVVAAAAGAGLLWWERKPAAPLIDMAMLAAARIAPALFGATCAYMVLFGPLVLLPQTMTTAGSSVLESGLLLAALPAGFGLAAATAERLLPAGWSNRQRCAAGGLLAACSVAGLAVPGPPAATVLWLALVGSGLGVYIPANNAHIMAATPAHDAAKTGGMVNMARGMGTALGVALVTLGLHAGMHLDRAEPGTLAVGALTIAAIAATWAGTRSSARAAGTNSGSSPRSWRSPAGQVISTTNLNGLMNGRKVTRYPRQRASEQTASNGSNWRAEPRGLRR
jgi:EmrB/QacA subfamily drug resistance transporter